MGDVAARFVRRMPHLEYLHLVAAADVLLDPRPYGGGVTSYDGFSLGKPIVTWPTQFHRGRYVLGHYRKMEIMDCVAPWARSTWTWPSASARIRSGVDSSGTR